MNVNNNSFKLVKKEVDMREGKGSTNCIVVGGGLVQQGENIEFSAAPGHHRVTEEVGQIISIQDRRYVSKSELRTSNIGRGPEGDKVVLVRILAPARPRITSRRTHPNVPDNLPEVVGTSSFKWICPEDIDSIAFVFHADSVDSGMYLCGGMQNAYITRQTESEEGLQLLPQADFEPFKTHSTVKESYSKRIWNGLAALNEASFKALSAGGKWDGRTKHVHLQGCNFELAWCLIERLTASGSEVIQDDVEFTRAKKRLNADLSVSNKRIKTKGCLLRVLEEKALRQFRLSLGSTFGVANTKPVPTLKQVKNSNGRIKDTVHVCDHDLVRIVTCEEDDLDHDSDRDVAALLVTSHLSGSVDNQRDTLSDIRGLKKQPRRLPYPGIDLEFLQSATGITDLHVALKFKKMKGESESVKRAQNAVSADEIGIGVVTDDNNEKQQLAKGDEFIYDGVTYEVVSLDGAIVKCCKAGFNVVSLSLPIEEATELVNTFLQL